MGTLRAAVQGVMRGAWRDFFMRLAKFQVYVLLMQATKKRKSLGRISQDLALDFHGARVPTSTLSAFRARGIDIENADEVVGAVYYNLRKPIWFDQAYKARLQHWRLIQALLKNQDPQQPGEGT